MIILVIILIVILFLLIPVKLEVRIKNGEFKIFVFFFSVKFDISNGKKKTNKSRDIHAESKDFFSKLKFLGSNFGLVSSVFKFVIKKVKFKKIHFVIRVCAEDSKDCAVNYSYISASLNLLIQVFNLNKKTENLKIVVIPDFLSFETTYFGKIILSANLLEIICLLGIAKNT